MMKKEGESQRALYVLDEEELFIGIIYLVSGYKPELMEDLGSAGKIR